MFDTISIKKEISLYEHQDIMLLYPFMDRKQTRRGIVLTTTQLYPYGFDEVCLTSCKHREFKKYYLTIRISLSTVIFDKYDLGVVSYDELLDNNFEKHINRLFRKYLNLDYTFDEFNLSRIDYAIDYRVRSEKEIDALIALAKRSRGLTQRYFKKDPRDGSYYLKSKSKKGNGSVRVNWYKKKDKVQKQIEEGKDIPAESLKDMENVYRLEIQCNTRKIHHLRTQYGIRTRNPLEFINPTIAFDMIKGYLKRIIGNEDYYSLKRAYRKIRSNESIKNSMKKKLVVTLLLIKKTQDITQAKEVFINDGMIIPFYSEDKPFKGSKNTFDDYINRIKGIGINPATIPKKYGIEYISNPIRRINKMEKEQVIMEDYA